MKQRWTWTIPGAWLTGVLGMAIVMQGHVALQRQEAEHEAASDVQPIAWSQGPTWINALPAQEAAELAPAEASTDPAAEQLNQRFTDDVLPVLDAKCMGCHGFGVTRGGVSLDGAMDLDTLLAERELWTHALEVMQAHVMPPRNADPLTPEQHAVVTQWLADALAYHDMTAPRHPGSVTARRLNRDEYNRTMRDLLGLDLQLADAFPEDDSGYGFDNIADVLTLSPTLLEMYLDAADRALSQAIHTPEQGSVRQWSTNAADLDMSTSQYNSDGIYVHLYSAGAARWSLEVPVQATYEIRITAAQDRLGDEPAKVAVRCNGETLDTLDVPADPSSPAIYTTRVTLPQGQQTLEFAFINDAYIAPRDGQRAIDRNLYLHRIEITGPHDVTLPVPASHHRIFFVEPSDTLSPHDAARQVIQRFADRAWRRPATGEEVERLMTLYELAASEGDSHEASVAYALSAVLVSPHFLFRIETHPEPGNAEHIADLSQHALASRLSYFLWSSMPDDTLRDLADRGELDDPTVLRQQVRRMLQDERAQALTDNFAGQWLQLRNIVNVRPDREQFPDFSRALRGDMRREVERLFESVVRDDRPLSDLIDTRDAWLTPRLAELYGLSDLPELQGKGEGEFVKVRLPDDSPRGGVLTSAAVLAITSNPDRTSPVKRGLFVLEVVLNQPPPPPPPDVPNLDETPASQDAMTLRQRLELHRADPNCASCHDRLDPLGFALEGFDVLGGSRDQDGGAAIDTLAALPDGTQLDGSRGLKAHLLANREQFVHSAAEHLLIYALGRGLRPADAPYLNDIVQETMQDGERFEALVQAIVASDVFQQHAGVSE